MSLVATLISARTHAHLDQALLTRVLAVLGLGETAVDWLEPGFAADINVGNRPAAEVDQLLRAAIHPAPVDVVVQPRADRRKSILVADMDSTMIGQECIDELAAEVGLKQHVAAITDRAMHGEIAFEPALRERVGLLKGVPVAVIDKIIADRIHLTPGGRTLIGTMRANGGYAALVSGGFTLFTNRIGAMIGFNEMNANTLLVEGDRLAGRVAEPILGKDAKRERLLALSRERGVPMSATMAVGDGANDLDMIRIAGLGVAFRAKPAVAAEAAARIDHGDLTALLFVQGYRASDFVKD
ncbi:MAG: phosphoserine phosphatase SerB [Ancalomicrobiaceae bacterium]|nr:phosphoserine phosphatase SerB [Ancalomicrobiaceae bacterium]